jgi:hypothetical protein
MKAKRYGRSAYPSTSILTKEIPDIQKMLDSDEESKRHRLKQPNALISSIIAQMFVTTVRLSTGEKYSCGPMSRRSGNAE